MQRRNEIDNAKPVRYRDNNILYYMHICCELGHHSNSWNRIVGSSHCMLWLIVVTGTVLIRSGDLMTVCVNVYAMRRLRWRHRVCTACFQRCLEVQLIQFCCRLLRYLNCWSLGQSDTLTVDVTSSHLNYDNLVCSQLYVIVWVFVNALHIGYVFHLCFLTAVKFNVAKLCRVGQLSPLPHSRYC